MHMVFHVPENEEEEVEMEGALVVANVERST